MIFIGKISKGHNFLKNVGGVTVLFLCTSSDDGLYFLQSFMKNFNGIKAIQRTRFL